ncbi:MAG: glucose 1-dehydrogenase [Sphingomonadaceae bacterium]|nr:glucose 1-dehydrogenase [Sphingomonadaceae bacterium]
MSSPVQRLDGKVAVVTGGASGIGEAIVRQFIAEGGRVIIADVQAEQGEALARELGNATFVLTDVSSEAAIAHAIDQAVDRYGRLDSMVNNAGFIGAVGSIAETSHKHWQATLSVLLDAVFFGMKHAARQLRKQGKGGTILTTTSVAGLRGGFGAHAYTTAKHAVIGLTRSVAAELAADRIRVNAVAPGNVLSPLSMALIGTDAETADGLAAQASPLGLAMYPRDIAHAFAYLASDGAMHVTGQVITVDAGATMAPEAPAFHKIDAAFMGPAHLVSG